MDKREFLDILRQSLEGEVDNGIIEKNIRFYSDYISSQRDKSEEEVIESIGDPRLIAKTIIETEKLSNKENYKEDYGRSYDYNSHRNKGYYEDYKQDGYQDNTGKGKMFSYIKGYSKIAILIILILFALMILSLLIKIGWIILKFISVFFLPLVLIVLLLNIFWKNRS